MQYGQGMVRPGAWSVGGELVPALPEAVTAPALPEPMVDRPRLSEVIPGMWSDHLVLASEQKVARLREARLAPGAVYMGDGYWVS